MSRSVKVSLPLTWTVSTFATLLIRFLVEISLHVLLSDQQHLSLHHYQSPVRVQERYTSRKVTRPYPSVGPILKGQVKEASCQMTTRMTRKKKTGSGIVPNVFATFDITQVFFEQVVMVFLRSFFWKPMSLQMASN
jgi:hypothetical protein